MSRQRRTRFTAFVSHPSRNDVEKKLILAYEAHSVHSYFERCGYVVLEVRKGDFVNVKQQRPASGGFRIDQSALTEVKKFLGIKLPVQIKLNGRVGPTHATHRFPGDRHVINIKSYLTPEQASVALWHELAHAMQSERASAGKVFSSERREAWAKHLRQTAYGTGYWNKPHEVEARSYEQYAAEISPAIA